MRCHIAAQNDFAHSNNFLIEKWFDGGGHSLHRTRLSQYFPAIREFNREIRHNRIELERRYLASL